MKEMEHIMTVMEFDDETKRKIVSITGGTFRTFLRNTDKKLEQDLERLDINFAYGNLLDFR